jgi:ankyrin repeat protein
LYLLDAAGRGNLDIVKQRVEGGAFVDSSNAQDRTSLMIASAEGHISIVSYLLGKRADLNLVDKKGSYALKDAVLNGHFAVRDLLLQNGARIDEKDRLELGKQLCTHAGEGHIEGVRELLQCHASVNAVMYDQRTALHFAAAEGHDSVVAFLLDNRADPRLQDRWGATALIDATRGKHLRSQALLRVAVGESSDFVDASSGADPDRPGLTTRLTLDDSSGSAPMELTDGEKMCKAAARGDTTCLNKLVGRGAAVNAMDYDRRSALHLAGALQRRRMRPSGCVH